MQRYKMVSGYALIGSSFKRANEEMIVQSEASQAVFVGIETYDYTDFARFRIGRKNAWQLRQNVSYDSEFIPERIETLETVCEMLVSDACHLHSYTLTDLHKGRVNYQTNIHAICDYLAKDRRVCIRVAFYKFSTVIEVNELSKYDERKQCWTSEDRSYRTTIEDKKSRKPIFDLLKRAYREAFGWDHSGENYKMSIDKRNGVWRS